MTEAKTATTQPKSPPLQSEPAPQSPHVERVNIAGLVLEKTVFDSGECQTEVLSQPMIAPELIRATRSVQRQRGH
jgi:hypothetical protein